MKHALLALCITFLPLAAKEYFAKVEPFEIYTVASEVSGKVLGTARDLEGARLGASPYVVIDDALDQKELETVRTKLSALEETLSLNARVIERYEAMLERKRANYEKVLSLKVKSELEKDREFYDLAATEVQYLSTRKEIENLKTQKAELLLRRTQLQKSIADKHPAAEGYTLYQLLVKPSQFVAPGTPLAQIADTRRGRLVLYVDAQTAATVAEKVVYLDGKKSAYRVDRVWNIADEQQLSSYRVEIVVDAPKQFSRLVKVEFGDE